MINLNFNVARKALREKIFNLDYSLKEFEGKAQGLGLDIRNAKITDEIVRVPLVGKKSLDGWYALHLDNDVLYGVFGNWVNGVQETYSSKSEFLIDESLLQKIKQKKEEHFKRADEKKKLGAIEAQKVWDNAGEVSPNHPYLLKKKIRSFNIKQSGDALLIPIRDLDGKIISTQRILEDGTKLFQKDCNPVGSFVFGEVKDTAILCEGYATGASIYEATGLPVIVGFSAHSLVKIATLMKGIRFVVAGDNDVAGKEAVSGILSACLDARSVFPEGEGQDWNDVYQEAPEKVKQAFLKKDVLPFKKFEALDVNELPYPEFIYSDFYARGYTSVTLASPKLGKSLFAIAEAFDMATGLGILTGYQTEKRRVLVYNAEDDQSILDARISALCIKNQVSQKLLEGQLWLTSGVEWNNFFLIEGEDGKIREDIFEGLHDFILENNIDCVIFDPLQDLSDAGEDNNVFRRLGRRLRKLASETNCSIHIIHHTRKMPTTGFTGDLLDSGRGGSSLRGTARFNRVLISMSETEAKNAGVDNHRHYFRIADSESNLAPPSSSINRWFKKDSVQLPKFSVGAVETWKYPDPFDDVQVADVGRLQGLLRGMSEYPSADVRSANWVGHLVAEVFDKDLEKISDKGMVKRMIKTWIENDVLRVEKHKDKRSGREIRVVVCGDSNVLFKSAT